MRWTVIDDAVPAATCGALVDFYRRNIETYGWKNKVGFWSFRLINSHDLPDGSDSKVTLNAIGRLVVDSIAREWGEDASIQASQVVSWPEGTRQDAHLDRFFPNTRFAAILYLNDDYAGGQTFLEIPQRIERVDPATGRLLIFEGAGILHGVEEIVNGERYTNALWLG
ncbi:2OG-Fe(II) oxygenase [Krasilnikovia sp. M28-CT-15]|uniref:2OG-Fe(II) oxygenase n=1 Tax=Krasilnikovia sp. M28-CT-15 TaxID=3373540 RepID=UPI003876CD42